MPHKPHRAVHADEGTLDEHGCCRQSDDNVDIFVHGSGWSFRSHHDSILGDEDLRIFYSNSQSRLAANYSSVRDLILTSNISNGAGSLEECGDKFSADELHISDSCHVRIPPMLFAKDVMEILPPKTIPSSSGQESNSAETSPINRFGIKISATDGILCWAIKVICSFMSPLRLTSWE